MAVDRRGRQSFGEEFGMGKILQFVIPAIWLILTVFFFIDCIRHRRDWYWYLVLLLPGIGVIVYLFAFKIR